MGLALALLWPARSSLRKFSAVHFRDLNETQILALAITAEEEDARIYRDFAESLRTDFPATAELFTRMAEEEDGHRHRLIELYRQRFGEHIPLLRRQDVKGFIVRRPSWFTRTLRPENARAEAALMEIEARRFYEAAAQRTNDAGIRQLLDDLAQEEQRHEATAGEITDAQATSGALSHERDAARRLFVLRFVQPGLAGLMDGSVSTLAPLFAAAFATGNTLATFKVGLAASVGAGISMGFAEALSDDGKLSGRGIGGHCLDSQTLHGHAVALRGVSDRGRRRARFSRRLVDWSGLREFMAEAFARLEYRSVPAAGLMSSNGLFVWTSRTRMPSTLGRPCDVSLGAGFSTVELCMLLEQPGKSMGGRFRRTRRDAID